MSLDWTVWQLIDSFFPTGGFAHSYGLEAATQIGLVSDPSSFQRFVELTIENAGSLLLPFVFAGHGITDVEAWVNADQVLDATLASNRVARKASSSQGSSLLRTAEGVFRGYPLLKAMKTRKLKGDVAVHHALVFGVVCGLLGMEAIATQRAYLFVSTRDLYSAATRLGLVGPLAAAASQQSMSGFAECIIQRYHSRALDESHQVTPLLDVVQGCHDQLFSRLFCS